MNINELRAALDEVKDSDDELEVFVVADHGQDLENAFRAGIVNAAKDGGEYFEIHPDDLNDFEEDEVHRVFLIEG